MHSKNLNAVMYLGNFMVDVKNKASSFLLMALFPPYIRHMIRVSERKGLLRNSAAASVEALEYLHRVRRSWKARVRNMVMAKHGSVKGGLNGKGRAGMQPNVWTGGGGW